MKSEAIMIAFATKSFIQTRETKNACRSLYTEPDNSFYVSIWRVIRMFDNNSDIYHPIIE